MSSKKNLAFFATFFGKGFMISNLFKVSKEMTFQMNDWSLFKCDIIMVTITKMK